MRNRHSAKELETELSDDELTFSFKGLSELRIAVVSHLRFPIAPPFMGGMEAHSHLLTKALIARGHDVTLFASGDSDADLPLKAICPKHHETVLPWALWKDAHELSKIQDVAFEQAVSVIEAGGFDVVHNNTMHPTVLDWGARSGHPVVTSLHIPPFDGLANAVRNNAAPWMRETTTSQAHMQSWWLEPPSSARVVYNGIDIGRWPFQAEGNGRAVWCGRITPNKGTAQAIAAAKSYGIPIDLIGPIDCSDYFRDHVAPHFDDRCVYHGAMQGDTLTRTLGAASLLLATPMWDEPFGLVTVEAMACGVPVAALDRGAMSEVVGDCGQLVGDPRDLPSAMRYARDVPRKLCRERVRRLFSVEAMIDGYEAAYQEAIAARPDNRSITVAALA